jgi:hypothetical protein
MHRHVPILIFAAAMGLLPASAALPQEVAQTQPQTPGEPSTAPGWRFTPSIGYGQVYDDNVLMQGKESAPPSDLLSLITPKAELDFNGRRGHLTADYTGGFEFYRQFNSLNNFNQFEAVSARRLMTSHTTLYVEQQFAMTPTTELPALAGIPFARIGSRVLGLRVGIEHYFTKHTEVSASYNFQDIAFNKDPVTGLVLLGGQGNGASVVVRHEMTAMIALLVDYNLQVASVINSGNSTINNLLAGGEYKFSATTSILAEAGIARLSPNALTPAYTGPAWQAGLTHRMGRTNVDVTYTRGYVPSFGNGQTIDSDDFGAHFRTPLARRVYTQGSADWRRDTPLKGTTALPGYQNLRTLLFSGLVGYSANQWLRIEGYFSTSRQTINRPGGEVDVNRVGIQVGMSTKPKRLF